MTEYVRIPGSARRYKNVDTGEEISRREYIKRTEKTTPEQKHINESEKAKQSR